MESNINSRIPFHCYTELPEEAHQDLVNELGYFRSVHEVLNWCLMTQPPRKVVEFVQQDEYTIDIVICYNKELHAVFDTT